MRSGLALLPLSWHSDWHRSDIDISSTQSPGLLNTSCQHRDMFRRIDCRWLTHSRTGFPGRWTRHQSAPESWQSRSDSDPLSRAWRRSQSRCARADNARTLEHKQETGAANPLRSFCVPHDPMTVCLSHGRGTASPVRTPPLPDRQNITMLALMRCLRQALYPLRFSRPVRLA